MIIEIYFKAVKNFERKYSYTPVILICLLNVTTFALIFVTLCAMCIAQDLFQIGKTLLCICILIQLYYNPMTDLYS